LNGQCGPEIAITQGRLRPNRDGRREAPAGCLKSGGSAWLKYSPRMSFNQKSSGIRLSIFMIEGLQSEDHFGDRLGKRINVEAGNFAPGCSG